MSFSHFIDRPFIELQQVESTNNYATGMVHAGMAQNGTVVFAHHQTKGKGQRNKTWMSGAGMNIAMSIVVTPDTLLLSQSFLLSMAAAVAVHQFFAAHAGTDTKVKWPNDLYWCDRKAGGILIENIIQGSQWKAAVIGIGVNVNQTKFEDGTARPVSLKQITGVDHEPLALAKELYQVFGATYLQMQKDGEVIISSYKKALYKLQQPVRLKKGARIFDAVVKDVNLQGQLVVQTAMEELLDVGEVEWLHEY